MPEDKDEDHQCVDIFEVVLASDLVLDEINIAEFNYHNPWILFIILGFRNAKTLSRRNQFHCHFTWRRDDTNQRQRTIKDEILSENRDFTHLDYESSTIVRLGFSFKADRIEAKLTSYSRQTFRPLARQPTNRTIANQTIVDNTPFVVTNIIFDCPIIIENNIHKSQQLDDGAKSKATRLGNGLDANMVDCNASFCTRCHGCSSLCVPCWLPFTTIYTISFSTHSKQPRVLSKYWSRFVSEHSNTSRKPEVLSIVVLGRKVY